MNDAMRGVLLAFLVVLAACVPSGAMAPPGGAVTVRNVDGPEVMIRAGGRDLGRVACQSEITVDEAAAGSLPWDLEFVRPDGSMLGTVHEAANDFRAYIVVRADGVVAGTAPAIGPAPAGCP